MFSSNTKPIVADDWLRKIGRELTTDEREARRSAQWRVAVSTVKNNAFGGKLLDVWGLNFGVLVVDAELWSGHLVGHDVQNVWSAVGT